MRSLANLEIAVWLKAVKGMSSYPTCSCCHHLSPPSYSLHHLRHDNRFASLFKKKRGVCLHTQEVSCHSDGAECKPGGDGDDNYCNDDGNRTMVVMVMVIMMVMMTMVVMVMVMMMTVVAYQHITTHHIPTRWESVMMIKGGNVSPSYSYHIWMRENNNLQIS